QRPNRARQRCNDERHEKAEAEFQIVSVLHETISFRSLIDCNDVRRRAQLSIRLKAERPRMSSFSLTPVAIAPRSYRVGVGVGVGSGFNGPPCPGFLVIAWSGVGVGVAEGALFDGGAV